MTIEMLDGLTNENNETIFLDKTKNTIRIKAKDNRTIGIMDYKLVPKDTLEILKNLKFIKKI
ncbi:hypothetical protein SAMN02745174_02199 [Cetobacterium ceti]|uniref:Uncharacterized protein n=1 Tax=Cetobacterium ceti TaxID=180163 RepID=A0A1T4Q6U4_9FUSO|nr:hypothetical protein [Cetobacterium ceti]SJZ99419.1 hypothetical protein SAMN02745174_02199 [Cetobacterium ceti]